MTMIKSEYRLELENQAENLEQLLIGMDATQCIEHLVRVAFPDKTCIVSSFGAESVVILHLVAKKMPEIPVIFLDTKKLFSETLEYRDKVVDFLGLRNVLTLAPNKHHLQADDPSGELHSTKPDLCCHIRKTQPLLRALAPYQAWISGRKRHHGGGRSDLSKIEVQDGKLKLNPLFDWSRDDIQDYIHRYDLPMHPLVAEGYPSVGCVPCTAPVTDAGADPRAGRWAGQDKTECGIHISDDGIVTRVSTAVDH